MNQWRKRNLPTLTFNKVVPVEEENAVNGWTPEWRAHLLIKR